MDDTVPVETQFVTPAEPQAVPVNSGVIRDNPEPEDSRSALVSKLTSRILEAREFWQPVFKQMHADMRFSAGKQWANDNDDAYVANITQRAVNQLVSSLYAKNPKAIARRRPRKEFTVWDEKQETLQGAQQEVAIAQLQAVQSTIPTEVSQGALALMADYQQGMQKKQLLDGVAETLELLHQNQIDTCEPPYKGQMKGMVRRAVTCGVGFIRVGFERDVEQLSQEQRTELESQAAGIQRRLADLQDGERAEDSATAEELKLMLAGFQQQMQQEPTVKHERLTHSWPKSTSVIVDPNVSNLTGFVDATWIAQEFILTPERVQELYGVDVGTCGAASYKDGEKLGTGSARSEPLATQDGSRDQTEMVCIWELWDKPTGLRYVLCDGYKDFLEEPAPPSPRLKRFFPLFAFPVNPVETEYNDPENGISPYPPSVVALMRPMQCEINRAREAARGHRIANRPAYGVAAGKLSDTDKDKLMSHQDNAVLELTGLGIGEKISDVLQPIQPFPIVREVYDTSFVMQDVLLVTGQQEANIGPTTGKTATESSIAESSRLTSTGSIVDDLDDFLSEVAEADGEILFAEMSEETVKSIVGPGAVWPGFTRSDIARELYLQIEAASSGRPNRNLEIQNAKELVPLMLQIPGINPEFLAKELIKRLDDRIDVTQAYTQGMPSVGQMGQPQQMPPGQPGQPEQPGEQTPAGTMPMQTVPPQMQGVNNYA